MVNVSELSGKILDIIVERFDYLRENPKHLAWVMMNYELVDELKSMKIVTKKERVVKKEKGIQVVRDIKSEEFIHPSFVFINPDDDTLTPIQQMYKRLNSEDDMNLAWAAADLMNQGFGKFPDSDPKNILQHKPNKILEEWLELLTTTGDYDYITYSKEDALMTLINYLPFKWNNKGFLIRATRSGIEERIFFGYTRSEMEVVEDIRLKVLAIRDDSLIVKYTRKLLQKYESERQRLYNGETYEEVFFPERTRRWREFDEALEESNELLKEIQEKSGIEVPRYHIGRDIERKKEDSPINIYWDSNFVHIPENAHNSYVNECLEIAQRALKDKRTKEATGKLAAEFLEKMNSRYFINAA